MTMKTQALVIANDPVYVNWLQNAVPSVDFTLLRPLDIDDLVQRISASGRVDLVLVEFDVAQMEGRAALLEQLVERMPDIAVAAVGAEPHPDVVLAAMRAGARDFLVLRRDDDELSQAVSRLLRRSAPTAGGAVTQRAAARGKLFSLVSSHPSEDLAFTAVQLAMALGEQVNAPGRVLLLDVATPAGAGAIFLNINQAYSVLDAINDVYRCDQTLIDTAFSRHPSGLYVLSLPEDLLGRPAIERDDLMQLLQMLRGLFAVTVVVLDGLHPPPLLGAVMGQSDRSLWLTDPSILRSRHGKVLLRALRLSETPLDTVGVVVDRYRRNLGLEPENIAELLGLPLLATLGGDGQARIQAMNAGEPLSAVAPRDALVSDIRHLAAHLMSAEAPTSLPVRGGGMLKRWFGG